MIEIGLRSELITLAFVFGIAIARVARMRPGAGR